MEAATSREDGQGLIRISTCRVDLRGRDSTTLSPAASERLRTLANNYEYDHLNDLLEAGADK